MDVAGYWTGDVIRGRCARNESRRELRYATSMSVVVV